MKYMLQNNYLQYGYVGHRPSKPKLLLDHCSKLGTLIRDSPSTGMVMQPYVSSRVGSTA
jgi:hypothetical protein